jgi:hypothetical protein
MKASGFKMRTVRRRWAADPEGSIGDEAAPRLPITQTDRC